VVCSACRVDLSHLDSRALQMLSEPTFAAMGACGSGRGHGVHCACRPYRVHGMAHVPALDVRSRVLRGNVPDHRLANCGYVVPTRTSGPLKGVYPAQFGI
jgi:hypothetical protein